MKLLNRQKPDDGLLIHKRCNNHQEREAVARCPQCSQFFCRECVAEHEEQVLCTSCLKRILLKRRRKTLRYGRFSTAIQLAVGLFVIWSVFYYTGRVLLSIPSSFHEGTFWKTHWWDEP